MNLVSRESFRTHERKTSHREMTQVQFHTPRRIFVERKKEIREREAVVTNTNSDKQVKVWSAASSIHATRPSLCLSHSASCCLSACLFASLCVLFDCTMRYLLLLLLLWKKRRSRRRRRRKPGRTRNVIREEKEDEEKNGKVVDG